MNVHHRCGADSLALFYFISDVKKYIPKKRRMRMSLTRKFMQGMGLTEEQVNAIIEANEETITGLKAEIEKYKTASEDSEKNLKKVQKELDGIKDEAEKNEGKNPYKVKYEAVKEEFEAYKKDISAKETKATKTDAYKNLLKECGVSEKRINAIIKVSDVNSIEFDEDGKIKDVNDLKKNIKEEWSDFIQTEGVKGASTSRPPANEGGKMSKDDILAIKDTVQRQKAMLENKELFIE